MMGVYIKGMKMPTSCAVCGVRPEAKCPVGYKWLLQNPEYYEKRKPDCPLIQVPDHGRLIDADAILNSKGVGTQIAGWGKMYHETVIEYAPTIIPAEEVTP